MCDCGNDLSLHCMCKMNLMFYVDPALSAASTSPYGNWEGAVPGQILLRCDYNEQVQPDGQTREANITIDKWQVLLDSPATTNSDGVFGIICDGPFAYAALTNHGASDKPVRVVKIDMNSKQIVWDVIHPTPVQNATGSWPPLSKAGFAPHFNAAGATLSGAAGNIDWSASIGPDGLDVYFGTSPPFNNNLPLARLRINLDDGSLLQSQISPAFAPIANYFNGHPTYGQGNGNPTSGDTVNLARRPAGRLLAIPRYNSKHLAMGVCGASRKYHDGVTKDRIAVKLRCGTLTATGGWSGSGADLYEKEWVHDTQATTNPFAGLGAPGVAGGGVADFEGERYWAVAFSGLNGWDSGGENIHQWHASRTPWGDFQGDLYFNRPAPQVMEVYPKGVLMIYYRSGLAQYTPDSNPPEPQNGIPWIGYHDGTYSWTRRCDVQGSSEAPGQPGLPQLRLVGTDEVSIWLEIADSEFGIQRFTAADFFPEIFEPWKGEGSLYADRYIRLSKDGTQGELINHFYYGQLPDPGHIAPGFTIAPGYAELVKQIDCLASGRPHTYPLH